MTPQEQHPTWPMKKIMTVTATLWKNTSELDRKPFIDKAKLDSDRYKTQMKTFSQTDEYKKQKILQKRQGRLKKSVKYQTSKEFLLQTAFDLFSKDHGGTLDEIKALIAQQDPEVLLEVADGLQGRVGASTVSSSDDDDDDHDEE